VGKGGYLYTKSKMMELLRKQKNNNRPALIDYKIEWRMIIIDANRLMIECKILIIDAKRYFLLAII
jgi:hypothetical protein